jgi:hypothetical protein
MFDQSSNEQGHSREKFNRRNCLSDNLFAEVLGLEQHCKSLNNLFLVRKQLHDISPCLHPLLGKPVQVH